LSSGLSLHVSRRSTNRADARPESMPGCRGQAVCRGAVHISFCKCGERLHSFGVGSTRRRQQGKWRGTVPGSGVLPEGDGETSLRETSATTTALSSWIEECLHLWLDVPLVVAWLEQSLVLTQARTSTRTSTRSTPSPEARRPRTEPDTNAAPAIGQGRGAHRSDQSRAALPTLGQPAGCRYRERMTDVEAWGIASPTSRPGPTACTSTRTGRSVPRPRSAPARGWPHRPELAGVDEAPDAFGDPRKFKVYLDRVSLVRRRRRVIHVDPGLIERRAALVRPGSR